MRKLVWLAVAGLAVLGAATANAQTTPRKGGTIRMTAPYAASFGSLDPHVTPRAQDDIVNKAIHRTLYNWDTAKAKLEELRTRPRRGQEGEPRTLLDAARACRQRAAD